MKENRLAPATHSMASDSKELPLDKGKYFYKRTKQSLRHKIQKLTSLTFRQKTLVFNLIF